MRLQRIKHQTMSLFSRLQHRAEQVLASDDPYVRISVELRQSTLVWLDDLRKEWGLYSRGDLVSRLLDELAKPTSDA